MGKLWYGEAIYTMTGFGEEVEAIYTKEGRIIDTGLKHDLKTKYGDEIVEEVELGGTVLPGFIDSHLHIVGHGEKLIRLDLSEVNSRKEVIQKVGDSIKTLSDGEWLIGEGFNENNWDEPIMIHRKELDDVSDGHPVVLTRVCRHALVANSKAMEIAGVDEFTEEVAGGVIEHDPFGHLTGAFHDQAQELIKAVMPTPDHQFLTKAIKTSVEDLLSKGIVSGHSEDLSYYGGFNQAYDAFKKVIPNEKLFRAHLLVHHAVVDDLHEEGYQSQQKDDWLEFGAMKLFVDGALGGRTALLSEPYEDDPTTKGVSIHTDQELEALIKKARHYHMPIAAHTIGDQAVEKIVELVEMYPPTGELKDRIIHAQIMRPELTERMKGLPLIIDIQPLFVSSDFPWVIDRVGYERAMQSYPWRSFMEQGLLCAGGSDAPIEMVHPMISISAAVNRRSTYDGEAYNESQCISVYDAIKLYTVNPARVINKEDVQGQIKPGAFADFVVLDQDPFKVEKEKLQDIGVRTTIVNEQVVYQS
ncbi:amidohydrolase [Aquisalibacillus elongatus]|nr:amidohydrolase [Aquisalibacillus elongatus]